VNQLQSELNAANPAIPIRLFGVNEAGLESGNPTITNGRTIPWLQDTVADNVWVSWNVTYRDLVILDEKNEKIDVYNLTTHDLSVPANYAELKQKLLDAANR
jgi:hypothetical protein